MFIISVLPCVIRHIQIYEIEHSRIRCSVKWSVRSKKWRQKLQVKFKHVMKRCRFLHFLFKCINIRREWCIIYHFKFHPVPRMLSFEGWLFFVFRLANGSHDDPNNISRVRVIAFIYDLIPSTHRSNRHGSQVRVHRS